MDLDAVEDDSDAISLDGSFDGLPFTGFAGNEFRHRREVVNGAVAARRGDALVEVIEDLDFVAATQVEAAVAGGRAHVFVTHSEVLELFFADEVVAMRGVADFIDEHAVLRAPACAALRVAE